jgi:hypothetical protein
MSEFDNMKDEAGKLAQEHPEQVKQGEQFAGKRPRTWPRRSSAARVARVARTPGRAARTLARTSKPAAQPAPAARKACAITW